MPTKTMKLQDKDRKQSAEKKVGLSFSFSKNLSNIKSEFEKITWTSRDELISLTKIVVISTFLFSLFIYFVDVLVQNSLSLLGNIFHRVIG